MGLWEPAHIEASSCHSHLVKDVSLVAESFDMFFEDKCSRGGQIVYMTWWEPGLWKPPCMETLVGHSELKRVGTTYHPVILSQLARRSLHCI